MNKFIGALLVSGATVALASQAFAAPVVLENGFVRAGVNDVGTLGSGGTSAPGILFDATGTSNYGSPNPNDFLTPGDPFEGFYIKVGSSTNGNNNDTSSAPLGTASPISLTATSASWAGSNGTFGITNLYNLSTLSGVSVINITTTLTNLTGATIEDIRFERILDPDPDVNNFNVYNTNNALITPNQACGTGQFTGQTICISSNNNVFTKRAGITSGWSTDPDVILAGINDSPTGDASIALAFALGNLGAGASVTFEYFYSLGATREIVTGVPEPLTLSLFGAGLAGAAAAMRRRKKAHKA